MIKAFTDNLGDTVGVSSSQVRKDFSMLGISGNKRGGYVISELLNDLSGIIGSTHQEKIIVVGCGNIGRALIHYNGFRHDTFFVAAGFDIAAERINKEINATIPILLMEELENYIKDNKVRLAIIAVPDAVAHSTYENLIKYGIKGIVNFARVNLRDVAGVFVSNVNIELKIENLFYYLNFEEKNEKHEQQRI